jgi:hypothetical protein
MLAGGGASMRGWLIIGAALATLLTTFLATNVALYGALLSAQAACADGLFVGWIVGLRTTATSGPPRPRRGPRWSARSLTRHPTIRPAPRLAIIEPV